MSWPCRERTNCLQFPKLDRNSKIFSKHGGDRHGGRSTACHGSLEKVRIAYYSQNLIKTKIPRNTVNLLSGTQPLYSDH